MVHQEGSEGEIGQQLLLQGLECSFLQLLATGFHGRGAGEAGGRVQGAGPRVQGPPQRQAAGPAADQLPSSTSIWPAYAGISIWLSATSIRTCHQQGGAKTCQAHTTTMACHHSLPPLPLTAPLTCAGLFPTPRQHMCATSSSCWTLTAAQG
ncbi:hypothetical protein HaLaN_16135 [Haematococcus lacustris]|uniref:Uncharacterized protein n=1 Tax=Haematococcus lacustris TaxID=44745 RepID=A0A699ZTB8_HAELA|nr:hypothetical protein HaLaN_16135 [Haematococcus lacustris]